MPRLFHHTLTHTARSSPQSVALSLKQQSLSYAELVAQVETVAHSLVAAGLEPGQRVAVYLPKQFEAVISFYAISMAGGIFVPVNPLLKGPQAEYILQDCSVTMLVTSQSRYRQLQANFETVSSLKQIILTDVKQQDLPQACLNWQDLVSEENQTPLPQQISQDIAAILYTSGSTGKPKGVVLSHNNLVVGAKSVTEYLDNAPSDKLLAVLPFSFDYGLSQISTAFISGAELVLMEYLFPRDVIKAVAAHQITGLAAVPPLWVQLAELEWPEPARQSLRYITNSGGAMPQSTLAKLQRALPDTLPFLMYGLTEAFRSTYLPPTELASRPTSMGRAIPDAEIMVINAKGEKCLPGEEGELVHRGPHVALGYWNAPEKTAKRFKPWRHRSADGLVEETVVFSGDTVKQDSEGYFYFIGRQDDMIKSSGYRISPSEIEDLLYQYHGIAEVAAIGVPHRQLGQAILLVIKPTDKAFDKAALLQYCKRQLPNYMQPKALELKDSLPRNANGKIDRPKLQTEYQHRFESGESD